MSVTLATATADNVGIQPHGGTDALTASSPLSLTGSVTFDGLSVTVHSAALAVAPQAPFGGTIVLPTAAPADPKAAAPSLLVDNLTVDTVSVTRPAEDGPVTQLLTPGTPTTPNGLVYGS